MERWAGKIVVVTGASSGIGSCIVKELANAGMIVIGLARREDRMEQLKQELTGTKGEFHAYKCDVSDLESIKNAFNCINRDFGLVHVLVNNAGIIRNCMILSDGNESDLEEVINTNLMGPINCTKQAYPLMKGTGQECHIININSILGHYIPFLKGIPVTLNVYPSTKFALKAATEVLRQELLDDKNFRVSNISPGLVKTEISHASGHPHADLIMSTEEILLPEDVALAVKFVLEMPKHAQVSELTLMPVGQKF